MTGEQHGSMKEKARAPALSGADLREGRYHITPHDP